MALVSLWSCTTEPPEKYDLIIEHVSLIDGTGDSMTSSANIYVRNGETAAITSQPIEKATSENIIDGRGKYVIPGLMDAHLHLQHSPEKFERTMKQLIHFGVTNILVPGGSLATYENMEKLTNRERSGEIVAPRIYYTSLIGTLEGGHPMKMYGASHYQDSVNVHLVKDTHHIKGIVEEAAQHHTSGIKIMIEDGPMPPLTPRMPPEYIAAFTAAGEEYGQPVFAHVSDMTEVKMGVEGGVDAFMHFMGVQIDWEKDAEIVNQIVSDSISWVTTTMLAKSFFYPLNKDWINRKEFSVYGEDELQPLTDPDGKLAKESKMILSGILGSDSVPMKALLVPMMTDVKRLHDHGVNIVLGTDVGGRPYIMPGLSVHEEMELLQLGGFTAEEIIRISTHNGAKMLGMADKYGTIAVGQQADMIVLSEDPTEDISNTLSIEKVIKGGSVQERLKTDTTGFER